MRSLASLLGRSMGWCAWIRCRYPAQPHPPPPTQPPPNPSAVVRSLPQGLRAGGGIGDVMSFQTNNVPTYATRLVFDLTFFVIVTVILMNVIFGTCAPLPRTCAVVRSACLPLYRFVRNRVPCVAALLLKTADWFQLPPVCVLPPACAGIIIDTFADLRTISQSKVDDMKSVCFVCNIPRCVPAPPTTPGGRAGARSLFVYSVCRFPRGPVGRPLFSPVVCSVACLSLQ